MICTNCSKDFTPTRSDAKFCSDSCRVMNSRNKGGVTDRPVTDNPVAIVTDKKQNSKNPDLTCHACGYETDGLPICICHPCFSKGISHGTLGLDLGVCQKKADNMYPTRGIFRPLSAQSNPTV